MHSKIERKVQGLPTYPCPYTCIDSPIVNISHSSGAFVIIDELTLAHRDQSPYLTLGFTFGVVR